MNFYIFFKISYFPYSLEPLNPQKAHLGYLAHFMTNFHAYKYSCLEILVRKGTFFFHNYGKLYMEWQYDPQKAQLEYKAQMCAKSHK